MTPTLTVVIGMVLTLAGWRFLRRTHTTTPISQDELDRHLAEMRKAATEETPEEWIRYEASLALIHARADKNADHATAKRKTRTRPHLRALLRTGLAAIGSGLAGVAAVVWGPAWLLPLTMVLLLTAVFVRLVAVASLAAIQESDRAHDLPVLRVLASCFRTASVSHDNHKRERTETE